MKNERLRIKNKAIGFCMRRSPYRSSAGGGCGPPRFGLIRSVPAFPDNPRHGGRQCTPIFGPDRPEQRIFPPEFIIFAA